ncbi:MAG: hypothetical protein ACRD5G_04060 [Candidatus Acidiferrales bacterium]
MLNEPAIGFDLRALWEQIPLWLRLLVPLRRCVDETAAFLAACLI